MKIDKKALKNNLQLSYRGFKKQWDVFYRSKFGKVGFYIMLAFIIIALISPLMVHGNPFLSVPSEDYFTPVQLEDKSLGFTPDSAVNITSSVGDHSTNYYTFMAGSLKGNDYVFAIATNNGTAIPLFKTNGSAISLEAFTPASTSYVLQTYIMAATNHTIYITEVECTAFLNGKGASISTSNFVEKNVTANITAAYVSAGTFALTRPSSSKTQCVEDNTGTGYSPVYVYAFVSNSNNYSLNTYIAGDLEEYWHQELNFTPENLYFVGNQFSSSSYTDARIIITGEHYINEYYENGTMEYNLTTKSTVQKLYIPSFYQVAYLGAGYNTSYEASGDSVYSINIANGNETKIYTANATITAIGSTEGSSGIPSNFIVATSNNYLDSMSYNTTAGKLIVTNTIKTPFAITSIVPYTTSGEYILSNTANGNVIFLISTSYSTVNAFSWHFSSKSIITAPVIFNNHYNLEGYEYEIMFTSGSTLHIYSTEGKAEVLGPTLHTESGTSLPLGLNSAYNNVWKIYIDSFTPDLEVGFAAGIITIIIAVFAAMFIGYYGGIFSSFVETLSLSIFLIPALPLFIVLATVLGPTLMNMILIFSLIGWPFVTFSLIGIVRSVKTRTFVESATVSNLSTIQIMRRHILPNMGTLLAYLTSINIGGAVAAVSTYEILGLAPLTIPTWGGMLSGFLDDYFILGSEPWVVLPALITVTLFILAFIFIARGIDEVANPTLGDR